MSCKFFVFPPEFQIDVVSEDRQYGEWGNGVESKTGIIAAKNALNLLHGKLTEEGFDQVKRKVQDRSRQTNLFSSSLLSPKLYTESIGHDVATVTRYSPIKHQKIILVARSAFGYPDSNAGPAGVKPLEIEGTLDEVIFEAELTHK